MIFRKKDKIARSKEIIRREQIKIKEELKLQKEEKEKNKLLKKLFARSQKNRPLTLREQITSMIYFEILVVVPSNLVNKKILNLLFLT